MTLRNEIKPYTNVDGFIAGSVVEGLGRTNDNAILFTAMYYITLKDRGADVPGDRDVVRSLVEKFLVGGVLVRYPGDTSVDDSYDNYIAFTALCATYRLHNQAFRVLFHGLTHFGFYNVSGKFTWNALMFRFLNSLVPALLESSLFIMAPMLLIQAAPFVGLALTFVPGLLAALTIAISNRKDEKDNSDDRKNVWLLIKSMRYSFLCRLAAKLFWYPRLKKMYGQDGYKAVVSMYLGEDHPIARYTSHE